MDTRPLFRRLGWALAFVALVVAGDRALAAGLRAAVLDTENRFAVLYRGEIPADAVWVLGDSRGKSTFHAPTLADALDRPVFNLSENGLSTELVEVLLYDALDRNPRPSLVVIEATNVLSGGGQLREFLPFAGRSERLAAFADARLTPAQRWGRRLSGLYSFNGEMLFRALETGSASDQATAIPQQISEAFVETVEADPPVELALRSQAFAALGRMTDRLDADGIPYRLVAGPYLPAYRAKMTNFDALLNAAEDAAGTDVLDLSVAITDPRGFADRVHLNLGGAQQLAPILVERGVFADEPPADEPR